jgi:hypothetical protein
MPPSIIAVILSFPSLAEPLGGGGLAIGPGRPLVPRGGALTLAPLGALALREKRPSCYWTGSGNGPTNSMP